MRFQTPRYMPCKRQGWSDCARRLPPSAQHEATNSAAKAEVALKPHAMQDSADAAPVRAAPEATSKGDEGRENSRSTVSDPRGGGIEDVFGHEGGKKAYWRRQRVAIRASKACRPMQAGAILLPTRIARALAPRSTFCGAWPACAPERAVLLQSVVQPRRGIVRASGEGCRLPRPGRMRLFLQA